MVFFWQSWALAQEEAAFFSVQKQPQEELFIDTNITCELLVLTSSATLDVEKYVIFFHAL